MSRRSGATSPTRCSASSTASSSSSTSFPPCTPGEAAFRDAHARARGDGLGAPVGRASWLETAFALGTLRMPPPVISRVAFAATKADHVAERQRGNLAGLLRAVAAPAAEVRAGYFAIAAVRCTEDIVMQVGEHALSAVRGRRIGDDRPARPTRAKCPIALRARSSGRIRFLQIPEFEPLRLPDGGRGGVAEHHLDDLLALPPGGRTVTPPAPCPLSPRERDGVRAKPLVLQPFLELEHAIPKARPRAR